MNDLVRNSLWTLAVLVLIGSNVATVYIYGLIDAEGDCQVENVKLQDKVDDLVEENIQYQVGLQEKIEPNLK